MQINFAFSQTEKGTVYLTYTKGSDHQKLKVVDLHEKVQMIKSLL